MEKKKGFGDKLESFFAGKGFYIVLILCVAVIGVSAWVMLTGMETDVENESLSVTATPQQAAVTSIVPEPPVISDVSEPDASANASLPDTAEDEQTAAVDAQAPTDQAAPVSNMKPAFIWPISGEIEVPYAMETLRYDRTMADWRAHDGLDILAELGTQVLAVSSGVVEDVYTDDLYGVTVIIDHGNGLKSIYANLGETPTVYTGDNVTVGEVIGAVGTSALCEIGEAYHLHFAMRQDGVSVDPTEYLPAR